MKSDKKCPERVRRGDPHWRRSKPCGVAAGHGPDGAYCKTHARKYATTEVVLWKILPSYKDQRIGRLVAREVSDTSIWWQDGTRTNRTQDHFDTFEAAKQELIRRATNNVEHYEKGLVAAKAALARALEEKEPK